MRNADISEALPHSGLREWHCRPDNLRKRCDQMLTLRQDWVSITGGAVAADLVAQVDSMRQRDEVASHLTGAALDLLATTWPRRDRPPLTVETLRRSTWRISSIHYIYLSTNDDAALSTCLKLAQSSAVTAILPRCHERLKRRLLLAALCDRAPTIWSFDAFISWRTTSATIDQGWPPGRAVLELLSAYNRHITAAHGGDAVLVQVPQGLS